MLHGAEKLLDGVFADHRYFDEPRHRIGAFHIYVSRDIDNVTFLVH